MEGDRPPGERGDEFSLGGSYYSGSSYYGPYDGAPAPNPPRGPSFEAHQPTWAPPGATTHPVGPPVASGSSAVSSPRPQRRSPAAVVAVAAVTALLVGGAAGYGGALLARQGGTAAAPPSTAPPVSTDPTGSAPSASAQSTSTASTQASQSATPTAATTVVAGPGMVAVARAVLPGTVMIQAGNATGSGFVLDRRGRIMTNNHVVAAAEGGRIRVMFTDGRRVDAKLLGRSPSYDIAVIQVSAVTVSPLQLGRSASSQVGESVIAVGSPLGLRGTVTQGIVSAKDRAVAVGDRDDADAPVAYINAIQTDAPINPGNSGGPLVDANARVIGVNSAILTLGSARGQSGSIGLGFAIPIDQASAIGQQLIKEGKATYPVIGANVVKGGGGLRLSSVDQSGPAAKAGLRTDDVITKINGARVEAVDEFIVAVRTHRPNETVVLDYRRGKATRQARVVLGSREG